MFGIDLSIKFEHCPRGFVFLVSFSLMYILMGLNLHGRISMSIKERENIFSFIFWTIRWITVAVHVSYYLLKLSFSKKSALNEVKG